MSDKINELRTLLIEKNAELEHLRNLYSELLIRYDALRTLSSGFSVTYIPDDSEQRKAVTQALDMGNIFRSVNGSS